MQYVSLIEYLSGPYREEQSFAINEIHNSTSNLVFICRSIIAEIINPDRSAEQFFNKASEVKGVGLSPINDFDYRNLISILLY